MQIDVMRPMALGRQLFAALGDLIHSIFEASDELIDDMLGLDD